MAAIPCSNIIGPLHGEKTIFDHFLERDIRGILQNSMGFNLPLSCLRVRSASAASSNWIAISVASWTLLPEFIGPLDTHRMLIETNSDGATIVWGIATLGDQAGHEVRLPQSFWSSLVH
jgi:hypothetical protein